MVIELALAAGAAYGGYRWTKRFFIKRLRFVSKAHSRAAPFVAAAGALIVATPVVAVLPLLTIGTAAAFGVGVAGGMMAGEKQTQRTNIWGDPRP